MEEKVDFKSVMAKFAKSPESDGSKPKPPIASKPAIPPCKPKPTIFPKKVEPENDYSPMYPVAAWRDLTKELSSPNLKELAGGQIGTNIPNDKHKGEMGKTQQGVQSPKVTSQQVTAAQFGPQRPLKENNWKSNPSEADSPHTRRPVDFHQNLIHKLSRQPVVINETKSVPNKDQLPPKPTRTRLPSKPDVPRRKPLPNPKQLGPRPPKPTRPPLVDLTRFAKARGIATQMHPINGKIADCFKQRFEARDRVSPLLPHPRKMSTGSGPLNLSSSSCDEREEYDDVETVRPVIKRPAFSPSPPSKPKPLPSPKKDYFYDDVGSTETVFPPPPPELSKSQELRTNWKNLIMQQREAEEKEFRKKFKFDGEIKILTRMMVDPNAIIKKCGTYDLPHKRGDFLDVIQFSNPKDKMLCRNITWKFGYVPKRSLLSIEKDIYDDVGIFEELYDDIELISKVLPTVPPKVRLSSESDLSPLSKEKNLKKLKKEEKEEKDIKKKFKLEGEIKVLTQMMVDPNAKIKKGGGKYLSHKRGEILDVIERTSLEKMLCRNSKGKYGYVPRLYLLQVERQVYEYVDVSACV